MEANIGHLPTKVSYKEMQGWKVIHVLVSVTDGRTEDRRTQFGSLSLPSTSGLKVWKFEKVWKFIIILTNPFWVSEFITNNYIETYFTIAIQQYIRIALQDVQNNNDKNN